MWFHLQVLVCSLGLIPNTDKQQVAEITNGWPKSHSVSFTTSGIVLFHFLSVWSFMSLVFNYLSNTLFISEFFKTFSWSLESLFTSTHSTFQCWHVIFDTIFFFVCLVDFECLLGDTAYHRLQQLLPPSPTAIYVPPSWPWGHLHWAWSPKNTLIWTNLISRTHVPYLTRLLWELKQITSVKLPGKPLFPEQKVRQARERVSQRGPPKSKTASMPMIYLWKSSNVWIQLSYKFHYKQ